MADEIIITKKTATLRGDDGHKILSVRMPNELVDKLDDLSIKTDRSRNQLINMLLEAALKIVKIEE